MINVEYAVAKQVGRRMKKPFVELAFKFKFYEFFDVDVWLH